MRKFLAIILCILIGAQGIAAIPCGMKVRAEDMADDTGENEAGRSKHKEQSGESAGEDAAAESETGEITEQESGQENAEGTAKDGEQQEAGKAGVEVGAPSAILMEASTGTVIYEKDADTMRPPASVTKIMTLLLIFDALADQRITLEDEVQTSEYAASMGGSQVFLEPGETQTVDTMMKCIAVASANDACAPFKNRKPKDLLKTNRFLSLNFCKLWSISIVME